MMKRYIALALCAALLASLAVSLSFAGDDEPAVESNILVNNPYMNVDVEIEANGMSAERAEHAARVLSTIDLFGSGESCPDTGDIQTDFATELDTVVPGDTEKAPTGPASEDQCRQGKHSLVTTTAYYTKHLAYDTDPRCAVFTLNVTVCKKCSYMNTSVIAVERVSYCHPTHASENAKGDVNADGKVNAKDVTALMKHIVGVPLPKGSLFDKVAADMDKSGRINARDVTQLMKKIIGSQKRR